MRQFVGSCLLTVLAWSVLVGPVHAQATTSSPNGKDGVQIWKITPRTGAELPLPARFHFHLELKALLKTAPAGTVEVRFERGRHGPKQRLANAIVRPIHAGPGQHITLMSSEIALDRTIPRADRLFVTAILRNAAGKELSYSQSSYPLRGSSRLAPNPAPPLTDRLSVISCAPAPASALPTGTTTSFLVRFYYSVKSVRQAFVNLEFGDPDELRSGKCWYVSVVPVPQGTGIAEIRVDHLFPTSLAGRSMRLALSMRLVPLGPSYCREELKSFEFEPAQGNT